MVITQNSFMGHVLTYHRQFGITNDPEMLHAFSHFWRVIGHMIGIEDRFNLANGDLDTVTSRCAAIFRHILVPGLMNAKKDLPMMANAYFDGLMGVSSEFEAEKFIFISKRMSMVPGYYITERERHDQLAFIEKYPHYVPNKEELVQEMGQYEEKCKSFSQLKWAQRWDIMITDYILLNIVPKCDLARRIFNWINDLRIFFVKHMPILAIYRFGYKNAFVRVLNDEWN